MIDFIERHLQESAELIRKIDKESVGAVIRILCEVRERGGRLFLLGVGGGAANCSHAANDFRKLAGFEAYCPTDNISELTARINDEGWPGVFVAWLKTSRLCAKDAVFIMSVGGGDSENNISPNIVKAIDLAKETGAAILGIVGRDGGYTAKHADACVIIPPLNPAAVTPHTEAFQAVIWHLIVSHPDISKSSAKWESASQEHRL